MDANLVATELEMALLAKLLESEFVNSSSNLTLPASVLLHLLRTYLGPQVDLRDLKEAANRSPVLSWTPYAREIVVNGIGSSDGVRLTVHRWNPLAANRIPYEKKLREHAERPRPPIAATTFQGGGLGLRGERFEVRNEGYGTQRRIKVKALQLPDWVKGHFEGNTVTLTGQPAQAGVYRGEVTVLTNANALTFTVSAQSAEYRLPPHDELILEELLPDHPDLDRAASEALLEAHLTKLHFERLPGGLFVRRGVHEAAVRTDTWWLTEEALSSGSVPATGYPARFALFLDVDGRTDHFAPLDVTAEHGQLGGEFAELFDLLDVQVGQKLTLTPYQGGFKAVLSPAEPWRMASGHTYWLHGSREAALKQPELLEFLLRRCDDKNITVNFLLHGEGELPADLVRQHRAGRLTIRWSHEPLPLKFLVCGESDAGYVPPYGGLQRPVNPPQALWEVSLPLMGQDYREQAWQRGRGAEGSSENGLLDLELSVAMARLARAIKPMPAAPVPVSMTAKQRARLLDELPRRARELGVNERPIVAAPHLKALRVTAEQVNAGANGYRVTSGGYLVRRFQDVGRQREWARYVGNLYGGVLHHSQLRKLAEAFTGQSLDPASFVVASLDVMGWAGNGYRRPRQDWEPRRRELPVFTAEALAHFGTREETADWLRRNVAASEDQLSKALLRAQSIVAALPAQDLCPPQGREPNTAQAPATQGSQGKQGQKSTPVLKAGKSPGTAKTTGPQKPETLNRAAQPASASSRRPALKFAPLPLLTEQLPDPRQVPLAAVCSAVQRLVTREGPITESGLVRRYAALAKLNPAQVRTHVLNAAHLSSEKGEILKLSHPGGLVDFIRPGLEQKAFRVRERGYRQPEDIPLDEWCALLKALGLNAKECDDRQAFAEAVKAYRFGTAGGPARPAIHLAWQRHQQSGG